MPVVTGPLPAAALDPSEPISPELVLVCPELRELALAHAREFPAPQPFRARPTRARAPDRPEQAPLRRRAAGRLVVAAAAVFVVAALAVAPGFTGGERPQLAPSRPQPAAGPDREASVPVPQRPARDRPKSHARPKAPRLELALEAEQNVLRSPRSILRLGRAGAAFVDPATKLFRANATITCSVTRRRRNGSWERVCSVRRGRVSIRVRYVPTGRSSFRLIAVSSGLSKASG